MHRVPGFSLLEVLVALAIGSMIAAGGFQLLQNSMELTRANRSVIDADIALTSASLMLLADMEAAEPIQLGASRYRINVDGEVVEVSLARNGVTEEGLPGLISVLWRFSPDGITRRIGSKNGSEDEARVFVALPVALLPNPVRSQETGLSVWRLQILGRERELWLSNP